MCENASSAQQFSYSVQTVFGVRSPLKRLKLKKMVFDEGQTLLFCFEFLKSIEVHLNLWLLDFMMTNTRWTDSLIKIIITIKRKNIKRFSFVLQPWQIHLHRVMNLLAEKFAPFLPGWKIVYLSLFDLQYPQQKYMNYRIHGATLQLWIWRRGKVRETLQSNLCSHKVLMQIETMCFKEVKGLLCTFWWERVTSTKLCVGSGVGVGWRKERLCILKQI